MAKTYRVGIIGCGRIGGLLEEDPLRPHPCTHAGIYSAGPPFELVALASHKGESFDHFQRLFPGTAVYHNYKKMLKAEKLDVLSVATYATSHAEIVIAAARAGVRLIFCEKALAVSLGQADRMIEECRKNNAFLAVNYTRRWEECYIEAAKIIKEGRIGRLLYLNGSFSGNLLHTGTHMLDLFELYAGEPQAVAARTHQSFSGDGPEQVSGYGLGKKGFAEDLGGTGIIYYPNGVEAVVLGKPRGYFHFELDIIGNSGRIRIGNNKILELYTSKTSTNYTGFSELNPEPFPQLSGATPWQNIRSDLIASLETGSTPRCTGREARIALETALAFHWSDRKNGRRIPLPLSSRRLKVISR